MKKVLKTLTKSVTEVETEVEKIRTEISVATTLIEDLLEHMVSKSKNYNDLEELKGRLEKRDSDLSEVLGKWSAE